MKRLLAAVGVSLLASVPGIAPVGAQGANESGPYDSTADGSPSNNGNGGGNATGRPEAGSVGNADNKNPPGQLPGPQDRNSGYECDTNKGVAKGNPAHSGCTDVPPPGCPEDPAQCPPPEGCPEDPSKCPPPKGCPEVLPECPQPPLPPTPVVPVGVAVESAVVSLPTNVVEGAALTQPASAPLVDSSPPTQLAYTGKSGPFLAGLTGVAFTLILFGMGLLKLGKRPHFGVAS